MWTEITRPKYERTGQRYASDLTDREWAVIAPFMPAPKRLGRPRETDLRAVLDAILYIARSGCQWRLLADPAFVYRPGRRRVASGVKVAADTHLTEGAWKAAGGLIRVVLLERDGTIADLDLSGDFTCLPASSLSKLMARLRGAPVEEAPLVATIGAVIADLGLDLPGVSPAIPPFCNGRWLVNPFLSFGPVAGVSLLSGVGAWPPPDGVG